MGSVAVQYNQKEADVKKKAPQTAGLFSRFDYRIEPTWS
jgi:hypothetical protein